MKRLLILIPTAALTAAVIWYGLRSSTEASTATVAAILPNSTAAFVHLPDFNRANAELRRTDLYQIWSEPAVREFLQKPRSRVYEPDGFSHPLHDWEALEVKDAFAAVTSWGKEDYKVVGGFRFKGSTADVDKIIDRFRARLTKSGARSESKEYQQHKIESLTEGDHAIVCVYDGNWFLAANDLPALQELLDRLDGRVKDRSTTLAADATFTSAVNHMPHGYAGLIYARPDRFLEKVLPPPDKNPDGSTGETGGIRDVRGFCAATSFDGSLIRDTIFVGMPKQVNPEKLSRTSLALATKETFLYVAGFLNLARPSQFAGMPGAPAWFGVSQKIAAALSASGITLDDWTSAFGAEFGLLGDWPSTSHWPGILATLPVKDSAKATGVLTALTTGGPEGGEWTRQEKGGVQYFSTHSGGKLFSFSPTIGLSDRVLIAGADPASVEAAMRSSAQGNSELAASRIFRDAERGVPPPTEAFVFIDPAQLYTKIDAVIRPMLFMGAAFLPGINDTVDLTKLPPPEAITKHLSPITMSQRYEGDGYVAESVGPVTVYQTIAGVAGMGAAATLFYKQQMGGWQQGRLPGAVAPAPVIAPPVSIPNAQPSPTPDDPGDD